jgi:hypothetical protein
LTGRSDSRYEPGVSLIGANVNATHQSLHFDDVFFHNDTNCIVLLEQLESTNGVFNGTSLVSAFQSYVDGRIRSDMCRVAMLWKYGGYYFDNDLVLLQDVTRYLLPSTTFATVMTARQHFGNPAGLFNAFVASAPRHPILTRALILHARYPHWSPDDKWRVTQGRKDPNIGTVLLRDAVRHVFGDAATYACERTGTCVRGLQLFREFPLENDGGYNTSSLHIDCDTLASCNFAVGDPSSGRVLFKSRVASKGKACPIYGRPCQPHPPIVPPLPPALDFSSLFRLPGTHHRRSLFPI